MYSLRSLLASHPRKVVLLAAAIAAILATSAYAYMTSLPPHEGPLVSITSPPLEFSMRMNKTEFVQGENVTIRLSLKNISNKTITLTWPDCYAAGGKYIPVFDFRITDVNGTLVYQFAQSGSSSLAMELTETLNPGDQMGFTFVWYQRTGYPESAQVSKGTYCVRGSTGPMGLTVDGQASGITLETPTIAFAIT